MSNNDIDIVKHNELSPRKELMFDEKSNSENEELVDSVASQPSAVPDCGGNSQGSSRHNHTQSNDIPFGSVTENKRKKTENSLSVEENSKTNELNIDRSLPTSVDEIRDQTQDSSLRTSVTNISSKTSHNMGNYMASEQVIVSVYYVFYVHCILCLQNDINDLKVCPQIFEFAPLELVWCIGIRKTINVDCVMY